MTQTIIKYVITETILRHFTGYLKSRRKYPENNGQKRNIYKKRLCFYGAFLPLVFFIW